MTYEPKSFNAAFTPPSNNPYPEPTSVQLIFKAICLRIVLILSIHLYLNFPKGLFPLGLSVNIFNSILLNINLLLDGMTVGNKDKLILIFNSLLPFRYTHIAAR